MLLVDDDPTFRSLGTGALDRREGLSVEAAATPSDALDALEGGAVDAVVSDVDMPGAEGDGRQLYRAVRVRKPTLPFLFFTGTPPARLSGSVDLRSDPAVGHVRKGALPDRYTALARQVERIVDRRTSGPGSTPEVRAIERFCR